MPVGRAVRIELENSLDAFERLNAAYIAAIHEQQISDRFIGSVSEIVRAIKAALDKLANTSWTRLTGVRSSSLYFPLTYDEKSFDRYVSERMPGAIDEHADLVTAIGRYQPYTPSGAPLKYLQGLYRTEAHHSFALHEQRDIDVNVTMFAGIPFMQITPNGFRIGAPKFLGIPVAANDTGSIEGYSAGQRVYRDVWFVSPSASVLDTLMSMHNAAVNAFIDVGVVGGLDMRRDEQDLKVVWSLTG